MQLGKAFGPTDIGSLDGKVGLAVTFLFYLGGFMLAMVLIVALTRYTIQLFSLLTGSVDTVHEKEGHEHNKLIRCGNSILRNTLEQSLMFLGFYFYWLHIQTGKYPSKSDNRKAKEAILYPLLFLVGRVLFAIGYFIGVKVHIQQLRAVGILLNIFGLLCLLGDITHHPVLDMFA